eukprot:8007810-Ditylum_brightwellii.AAC.1
MVPILIWQAYLHCDSCRGCCSCGGGTYFSMFVFLVVLHWYGQAGVAVAIVSSATTMHTPSVPPWDYNLDVKMMKQRSN